MNRCSWILVYGDLSPELVGALSTPICLQLWNWDRYWDNLIIIRQESLTWKYEDWVKIQVNCEYFLSRLDDSAATFRMRFASWNYRMLLPEWNVSNTKFVLREFNKVDRFSCEQLHFTRCWEIGESSRIWEARSAFTNSKHLWHQRDIRLFSRHRVYKAGIRLALPDSSETRKLTTGTKTASVWTQLLSY